MSVLNYLKNKLPFTISIIIVLFILNCVKNVEQWKKENDVIKWDVISYYGYLPATFIYHDYTLRFTENHIGPQKFIIWSDKAPNGGNVIRTTMGMSVMYSPFFFIAHAVAHFFEYDTSGYSEPYKLGLILSSIFYLTLGLFFLSKLLLKFFNPFVSAWVIVITIIGTNLFYYVTYDSAMSHPYSFTLIILFLWCTLRWYETDSKRYILYIGLILGLITLIRPTNVVIGLVFILWGVKNYRDFINRTKYLVSKYKILFIIPLLAFIVWIPQLLYWKSITGSFFYNSYGENNKFFFNNPMIIKGLFGYRHGWLIYSPVMIFSVLGMIVLIKRFKEMLLPIVLTSSLFIYIIFSWWCWWYGGAFGMRAMIDIYGLLALPMAAFFTYTLEWKKVFRYTALLASAFLLVIGIHHTDKFKHFSSHWDSMTKEAFWDSYLDKRPSSTFESKLRAPDYEKARKGIDAYVEK